MSEFDINATALSILDRLRPYASRVIAAWVASLAAYVETKYGIVLDPDTKANLAVGAIAVYGTIYPIVHRLLDKKWNPGDAASAHQAVAEKAEVKEMKLVADEAKKTAELKATPNYTE